MLLFRISDSWVEVDTSCLNVVDEVKPAKKVIPLEEPARAAIRALNFPVGAAPLKEVLKGKSRVLVILNDITRPTPYRYMLPAIVDLLDGKGVKFVVATGTHRPNTDVEMLDMYGEELFARGFTVENHDCDGSHFIHCCTTSVGNDVYINGVIEQADVVVTTGVIGFHYFAGYSGGRKSLFPGIAERNSIGRNHALMVKKGSVAANIEGNPVNDEMMEVASVFGERLFIFNAVTSPAGEVLGFFAGNYENAWLKGVELYDSYFKVRIHELADVVIADAGGYPKDINAYQVQKALDNALRAVRDGGTIILIAGCVEGFGNAVFEEWLKDARSPEDVVHRLSQGFVLGGHKAYAVASAVKKADVILVSHMRPEDVSTMFFRYAPSVDVAMEMAEEKHGKGFSVTLFPNASSLLPVL